MATIINRSQSFTDEYTQILGAVEGNFPFPGVTDFVTEIIIFSPLSIQHNMCQ